MDDASKLILTALAFLGVGIVIGIYLPKPSELGYEPLDETYVCDVDTY